MQNYIPNQIKHGKLDILLVLGFSHLFGVSSPGIRYCLSGNCVVGHVECQFGVFGVLINDCQSDSRESWSAAWYKTRIQHGHLMTWLYSLSTFLCVTETTIDRCLWYGLTLSHFSSMYIAHLLFFKWSIFNTILSFQVVLLSSMLCSYMFDLWKSWYKF